MEIMPAASISGEIVLPGDKSISHRAAILASIAEGVTRVHNFSGSADCHATLECLRRLGVEISQTAADVIVTGVGKSGFSPPAAALDCGNSGTTMRLLCGLLAGQDFESVLTGDESLQKRPMGRVIAPLGEMGAVIESCGGFAPLTIHGRSPLRAASITPEFASAQVKSAILLAGLNSDGNTSVIETTQTRDHTERMLRWLGAAVDVEIIDGGMRLTVSGDATLAGRDITVPSDISAATFFAIAAACLPDSEILMKGVGVNGSRRAILDVLIRFGANIEITDEREVCNEPVADIRVRGGLAERPEGNLINGKAVASLIDEIPALAVFGTQLPGGLEVRDASELRVKESDRIETVVLNLRRMNAEVEEFDDGFRVHRSQLKGAVIDPAGDHRIAMAFAVAGLLAEGVTTIENAECCGVSFPGFFEVLRRVAHNDRTAASGEAGKRPLQ